MSALTLQIEAYAFRELVAHLQWQSGVQNIDLMNLAGFCRNCLAKWYHAGAKVYGLPMDYSEACERVYGEPYPQWKKRHQSPATAEQMAIFESSKPKHARTDPGPVLRQPGGGAAEAAGPAPAGHSSVCGQTCDAAPVPAPALAYSSAVPVRIGVLTCSDRAARGEYADESGPAIVSLVSAFGETSGALAPTFVHQLVVPDVEEEIHGALSAWSAARECDLILTTGGTGLGPRDVTPEATKRVVRRPADGIARAMAWQTSLVEPHSVLSRGVCGVTDTEVLVVNLPGHPSAVRQCLSVLLPVLPRALEMLGSPGAS